MLGVLAPASCPLSLCPPPAYMCCMDGVPTVSSRRRRHGSSRPAGSTVLAALSSRGRRLPHAAAPVFGRMAADAQRERRCRRSRSPSVGWRSTCRRPSAVGSLPWRGTQPEVIRAILMPRERVAPQPEVIRAILMPRERVAPQSEVIRAVVLEDSPHPSGRRRTVSRNTGSWPRPPPPSSWRSTGALWSQRRFVCQGTRSTR